MTCMHAREHAWHIPRPRGWAGGRGPRTLARHTRPTRHKRHFPASAGAPRTKSLRDFPRGVCGGQYTGTAQALRACSVRRAHKREALGQRTRCYVHAPYEGSARGGPINIIIIMRREFKPEATNSGRLTTPVSFSPLAMRATPGGGCSAPRATNP